MPTDVRLTQLARILGLSLDGNDEAAVRAAASARPDDLAEAFFREAADSDDVVDVESAREYLESRIAFMGDVLPNETGDDVRAGFEARLRAWE